jgi:hypothetical protein
MTVAESSATAQPGTIPLRGETVKTNMKTMAEINVHGRNPEKTKLLRNMAHSAGSLGARSRSRIIRCRGESVAYL